MSNTLLNYPWLVSWYSARRRCTDSKHHNARNYCNKGIKFYLTKAEIKALWFRDKAYNMSRPSIDRKNSDGHYEYNNCRFLELSKNRAEARRRKIVQTSLDGKLIKKWDSMRQAAHELSLIEQSISRVCRKIRKKYRNFRWIYEEEYND